MNKIFVILLTSVLISAANLPLSDKDRLAIARLLDSSGRSWLDVDLGSLKISVSAKTGKVTYFFYNKELKPGESINLKVIDQALLDRMSTIKNVLDKFPDGHEK